MQRCDEWIPETLPADAEKTERQGRSSPGGLRNAVHVLENAHHPLSSWQNPGQSHPILPGSLEEMTTSKRLRWRTTLSRASKSLPRRIPRARRQFRKPRTNSLEKNVPQSLRQWKASRDRGPIGLLVQPSPWSGRNRQAGKYPHRFASHSRLSEGHTY